MRIVTGETGADSYRLMRYLVGKIFTVMAGQTVNFRRGRSMGCQDDEQGSAENNYGFQNAK